MKRRLAATRLMGMAALGAALVAGCGEGGSEAGGEESEPLIAGFDDAFVEECLARYNDAPPGSPAHNGTPAGFYIKNESFHPLQIHLDQTEDGRCVLVVISARTGNAIPLENNTPAARQDTTYLWSPYTAITGETQLVPNDPTNPQSVDVVSPSTIVPIAQIPPELREPNLHLEGEELVAGAEPSESSASAPDGESEPAETTSIADEDPAPTETETPTETEPLEGEECPSPEEAQIVDLSATGVTCDEAAEVATTFIAETDDIGALDSVGTRPILSIGVTCEDYPAGSGGTAPVTCRGPDGGEVGFAVRLPLP